MKFEIEWKEWNEICHEADKEMKESNGHSYMTILKTRCQYCGRSPKQKGKCPAWVNTYMDILYRLLNSAGKENDKVPGTNESNDTNDSKTS